MSAPARLSPSGSSLRRGSGPAALALAFVVTLAIALLAGPKPFYYDAGAYWRLADSFTKQGTFSLLNFDSSLRGYALPLIIHGLREVSAALGIDDVTAAAIFNSLVVALVCAVLGPRFAEVAWPQRRWGILRRLGLTAVLLVFWHGYLSFPLSDFPALAIALLALVAISRHDAPGWVLLAGVAGGLAVDVRPAYLPLVALLPALLAFAWLGERGSAHATIGRRAVCAALLVLGFVAVAMPQSLATQRHHGSSSFVPGSVQDLSRFQLAIGLSLQRYETYVGQERAGARMFYWDETGQRLLAEAGGGEIDDSREYLGLILSHPLVMAGVFGRHLVNGLDQRYATPYVETLDTTGSNRPLRLTGFLIVFLALLRVAWPAARRRLGPARWRYPVALLLTCATTLPSAMETRFLLPVYLLCYVLVLAAPWPSPLGLAGTGLRRFRTPAVIAVAYVAFMVVVIGVIEGATDHLVFLN